LYNRLSPEFAGKLAPFLQHIEKQLSNDEIHYRMAPLCAVTDDIRTNCREAEAAQSDLLIIAHLSYSPSGQILPPLLETKLPLLLWPIQPMAELEAAKYDADTVMNNHGVHGTQDLANMLRRKNRPFGILHGHHENPDVLEQLRSWVRAGRMVRAMQEAKPLVLGGRFDDMLDLQLDQEDFLHEAGLQGRDIPLDDYLRRLKKTDSQAVLAKVAYYRQNFDIAPNCTDELLRQAALHSVTLSQLMQDYHSKAIGINFLGACNQPEIADACHVAACDLMAQGCGYGGEGDWTTAMINYALMQAGCQTTFTEIFSVGYRDNRLVVRHWGEGNYRTARGRVSLEASACRDRHNAAFAIASFEFQPGPVMLINLNTTPLSEGQLISISGEIAGDALPLNKGPRGIFVPDCTDVAELLSGYAYSGGSHHLNMVYGDESELLNCLAALTGWAYLSE